MAGVSCLIWGSPGIGKSDLVRSIAAESTYRIEYRVDDALLADPRIKALYYLPSEDPKDPPAPAVHRGRKVFDVRLVLCTPTDLKGIPVFSSQRRDAVWVMSGMLPTSLERVKELEMMVLSCIKEKDTSSIDYNQYVEMLVSALHDQHSILFLDEISQAPTTVQAAAFGLVLDRKIQSYELPEGVSIAAASNEYTDRAAINRMPTPLLSRFTHISMVPSFADWEEWAIRTDDRGIPNIESDILAYLKFNSDHFYNFDPSGLRGENGKSSNITFACPRTWHMSSKLIRAFDEKNPNADDSDRDILEEILSGTVGASAASLFNAWRREFRHMPSPALVLDGAMERKQVKFEVTRDGVREEDPSMEFAFILSMYRMLVDRINSGYRDDSERALQIGRAFAFVLDDGTKKEFAAVLFQIIVNGDNGAKQVLFKHPKFFEMSSALSNAGAFKK
jgi:MoxR-like ATPase